MNSIRFSVVIPSHKRKKLLWNLLQSLVQQSFTNFEVIVVATENDEAFALSANQFPFPVEFCFIPNDPTHGRSASLKRNYGAQKAQGEWVAFIDDDCVASPQWLQEAETIINQSNIQFLEGAVEIPKPDKPTFPYKGIVRLSRPGGFQTCNMFYRKQDFLQLGGFDQNFPYYLEDTDLAWTFKEANKQSAFAEQAVVSHPVPDPVPKKMLESAIRMEKLPYLYKKHPETFRQSSMRALPRPYVVLAALDIGTFLALISAPQVSLFVLGLRLGLTILLLFRMMRGCFYTRNEFSQMFYYLLICPLISVFSLLKGNIKNNVWLFLR